MPRFRVSDWASFQHGPRRVWAQVEGGRGPLGVNGRRLYRIRFDTPPEKAVSFEMPEDDLSPAKADHDAVIEYLKAGGSVALLRTNLGGTPQPRAWLSFDAAGQQVHTLDEGRGVVGGCPVPFFTLQGERIFTPKADEVIEFLAGFGLSRAEADDVIRAVGTTP